MEDELDIVIAMNNMDASRREKLVDTYKSCTIEQLAEEIVDLRAELEQVRKGYDHAAEIDRQHIISLNRELGQMKKERDELQTRFNEMAIDMQESEQQLAIERKALELSYQYILHHCIDDNVSPEYFRKEAAK